MAIYSGVSHKKMVIFHSYVKLPDGIILLTVLYHILFEMILVRW